MKDFYFKIYTSFFFFQFIVIANITQKVSTLVFLMEPPSLGRDVASLRAKNVDG